MLNTRSMLTSNGSSPRAVVVLMLVAICGGTVFFIGLPSRPTNPGQGRARAAIARAAGGGLQGSDGVVTTDLPAVDEAHVKSLLSHVESEYKAACGTMLRGGQFSFAQAWQDWYIYHNYFRGRAWGEGTYIDVGGNDPLVISNTLFYDKCLGWKGLVFEPQEQYHAAWKESRSVTLIPSCVSSNKKTSFSMTGSGPTGVFMEVKKGGAGTTCVELAETLLKHDITHVDFMSVDVETMEGEVLGCFPFGDFDVQLFLVETNIPGNSATHSTNIFFSRAGYNLVEIFYNSVKNQPSNKAPYADNYMADSLYQKKTHRTLYPDVGKAVDCAHMKQFAGDHCAPWQMWNHGSNPRNADPWKKSNLFYCREDPRGVKPV